MGGRHGAYAPARRVWALLGETPDEYIEANEEAWVPVEQ